MEACFTHLVNNSLVSKKELYKLAPRLFLIQNAVDQIVERLSAGLKCSCYSLAVVNIFTMPAQTTFSSVRSLKGKDSQHDASMTFLSITASFLSIPLPPPLTTPTSYYHPSATTMSHISHDIDLPALQLTQAGGNIEDAAFILIHEGSCSVCLPLIFLI